jgi:hypothetical protein
MNWVELEKEGELSFRLGAGPLFQISYVRPGGELTRVGPMAEEYARSMAQEYHRKGLKGVTLEEWAPVKAWRLSAEGG